MATVLTSVGETVLIDLIDGTSSTHLDNTNAKIGWGTNGTTAVKGDTNLGTASNESRVAVTTSQPTADKLQWVGTVTSGGSQTIAEAGLFSGAGSGNPPTGGTLIIHGDHTGQAVASGDKIEYTITLEQT
jgi:hypothetical protein